MKPVPFVIATLAALGGGALLAVASLQGAHGASPEANSAKVSFDGISSSGALTRAQYSLDAGDWLIVFPKGLLSDAPRENYQIYLAGLSSGEHTLAVQVSDRFGNTTAAKVTFTISGHASN